MSTGCEILQLKIYLKHLSPMIWRRVLVPTSMTLRELHGVIQVSMGWEGHHLYVFNLHAVDYGPIDLCVANPDLPLSDFELRTKDRFSYVYDMGDYWEHEIRIEDILTAKPKTSYPVCTGGARRCPREDSGGVAGHQFREEEAFGYEAWRDLDTIFGFHQNMLDKCDCGEVPTGDDLYEVEDALDRARARQRYLDDKFSRKDVNDLFRQGRHEKLKFQNTEVIFEFG